MAATKVKRSTPLRRKTPLRRRAPGGATGATKGQEGTPARRRTPSRGPSQKWDAWRNRQRERIRQRSWRCESPTMCMEKGIHVHHTFGRLGEPWASSYLLGLNLCFNDHDQAHQKVDYRDRLRSIALLRLSRYLAENIPTDRSLILTTADQMLRYEPTRATYEWLMSIARSAGIQPPDWKEA